MNQGVPTDDHKKLINLLPILVWLVILIVCIINRDKISIQSIIDYSPSNKALAAVAMWVLFALKSVSFVFYCGILYAASGLLFPWYMAIIVNLVGTVIMFTIPFMLGRYYGKDKAAALLEKYPKLKSVHEIRSENDFLFSFIIRLAARLPSDVVSMYMGATDTNFKAYLLGSMLGMLPLSIAVTLFGTSIIDGNSPLFIIVFISEAVITVVSVLLFIKYTKRKLSERQKAQAADDTKGV